MIQTLGLAQRDKGSDQLFAASFLGGAMLSWGSILMMVVAGGAPCLAGDPGLQALLRGTVFPLGLSLIVLSKSELVTANFLTQALPPPSADALRVVGVSFAANLAGSLAMVGLASYAGIFTPGGAAMIVKAASGKAALSPGVAFAKGVGANWLVNLAVFQAMSSPTAPGKIAALWFVDRARRRRPFEIRRDVQEQCNPRLPPRRRRDLARDPRRPPRLEVGRSGRIRAGNPRGGAARPSPRSYAAKASPDARFPILTFITLNLEHSARRPSGNQLVLALRRPSR